jgi:hypothetical protein
MMPSFWAKYGDNYNSIFISSRVSVIRRGEVILSLSASVNETFGIFSNVSFLNFNNLASETPLIAGISKHDSKVLN